MAKSREEMLAMGVRFTKENAREMQRRSALARSGRKTLVQHILENMSDEDIKEVARGMITRAKKSTMAATALRDTLGEKPVDEVIADAEVVTLTAEEKAQERKKYAESIAQSWKD